jgi:hypothetical protein
MYEFALIANVILGIINLSRSNEQYEQGKYSEANFSFTFAMLNIMMGLSMIGYLVYRFLAA